MIDATHDGSEYQLCRHRRVSATEPASNIPYPSGTHVRAIQYIRLIIQLTDSLSFQQRNENESLRSSALCDHYLAITIIRIVWSRYAKKQLKHSHTIQFQMLSNYFHSANDVSAVDTLWRSRPRPGRKLSLVERDVLDSKIIASNAAPLIGRQRRKSAREMRKSDRSETEITADTALCCRSVVKTLRNTSKGAQNTKNITASSDTSTPGRREGLLTNSIVQHFGKVRLRQKPQHSS